ncbi:MAG TPA: hypothetical protein VD794_05555 [Flavisolibacter sp.]|nr:hypothetical protein [Flavisolibacter sp.]
MKAIPVVTISLLVIISFSSFLKADNGKRFCSREFIDKRVKVFLKDEGIEATMMEVADKKTKKVAFGYFVNAMRNDTNFIYSKLSYAGDTIIAKTYRDYKITAGADSTINKYICTNKGLLFYSYQRYWNGMKVEHTIFNSMLIKF